jgi:hypothetical protein
LGKEYYLEDIMNPNAIKDRHRCKRCMVFWNFGDLFTCEDTSIYHVCNDSCKQLIIIDEYRAICGVSYRIYGLTSREIETVQAFLHKEWLQKIRGSLDKLIVMCDPKKKKYEFRRSIKILLIKTIKIRLAMITHLSKKIKIQLTKIIMTQLTKTPHLIKKMKTILFPKLLLHSTQLFTKRLPWRLFHKTLRMMINFYTCIVHLACMITRLTSHTRS